MTAAEKELLLAPRKKQQLKCPKCHSNNIIYVERCYQEICYTSWSVDEGELEYDGSTKGFGTDDGVMDGEKIYTHEYYCGDCLDCTSKNIKKFQ